MSVVTVADACRRVLTTADPRAKLMAARSVARDWRLGWLHMAFEGEIRPLRAGTIWFGWAAKRAGYDLAKHYQMLVKRHFRGDVKLPFNDSARDEAGLTRDF